MSDSIQSISNGNYILHNIDAKKLYVQEPLFTANNGDAVYVGWRPDETVLYSATPKEYGQSSSGESFQLSENISAFERLRFYVNCSRASTTYYETYEIDNYASTSAAFQYGPYPENSVNVNWFILRATIFGTTCNVSASYNSYTAVQNPDWNHKWFPGSLYKVVGVGRKENA